MLDGNPWRPQDIAYSILVGSVFLAALLEWFLWLAAFLYCLYMVFRKAENRSIRILAVLVSLAFGLLRLVFLPVMAVTVPLPRQLTGYIPDSFVDPLQLFACVAFSILLGVPWLLCIYHLLRHSIGPKQRIKEELTSATAPKVVVVMPCYHEIPEVLMTAINSACDADYPKSCLHLYVSFDGADIDDLYLSTLSSLGIALPLKTYPVSIDLVYRGVRITVSRFVHGGKRHCQKKSFRLIDKMYSSYLTTRDDLFILFIDSDIILDKFCVQNFIYEMELKNRARPAESRAAPMLAMTGIITCTAEKRSLLTVLQDIEYVHGQLYERTVESACGSVTCLPGALTMLRFTAFRNMAKYYFAESAEHAEDIFDFGKSHLGEDRWLTHLFMLGARNRFQIQLCTGAFCKTEAVMTYRTLLKQRRRWFLGFITNEACMLTDIRLWKMYPLLCVVRMMQNTIRTTALVLFIMILSVITGTQKFSQLPYSMIIVTLSLNWGLMVIVGWRLHRFKAWLYPLMYVVNPALNWCYLVYGIFTAGQRTWGGPRADKGGDEEEGLAGEFVDKDFVYEPVKFDQNGNAVPVRDDVSGGELVLARRKRLTVQPDDSVVGKFVAPDDDDQIASSSSSSTSNSLDYRDKRQLRAWEHPVSASIFHHEFRPTPWTSGFPSPASSSFVDSVYNVEDLYKQPRRPEKAKRRLLPWEPDAQRAQNRTSEDEIDEKAGFQEDEYSVASTSSSGSDESQRPSLRSLVSVYEIQPSSSHVTTNSSRHSVSVMQQSDSMPPRLQSSFSTHRRAAPPPPPLFTRHSAFHAANMPPPPPRPAAAADSPGRSGSPASAAYNVDWRRTIMGVPSPVTPRFTPSERQARWLDSQRRFFGMEDGEGGFGGESKTWL